MSSEKISEKLDPLRQCREYHLKLWQCPSFLFPLIGMIIISTMIGTYFFATKYVQPEVVALIVIGLTAILMVIGYLIIQSFESLAQVNRLKSEFINIVSHQLRTPLTNIKWLVNLVKRKHTETNNGITSETLKDIEDNNQRMIELVNDLLDASRIENGHLDFKPEKLSLEETVRRIMQEYTSFAEASNIEFSLESESDLPLIFVDKRGIGLIVENLIENAVKYTQKKSQIKIRLTKKNNFVRCEIEDQGIGIFAKDKKRIFHKFSRGRDARKRQAVGTGLGLFITKAFVDAFKGKIGFWSKEGEGSTFWFEIPIIK